MTAVAHDRVGAARAFVEDEEREFRPLAVASARAAWALATTGLDEHALTKQEIELEIRRFFADFGKQHRINAFDRALSTEVGADAATVRRVRLLKLAHLEGQTDEALLREQVSLQTTVENRFNNFRPRLDGRSVDDNDLRHVLARDDATPDERRAAWEATRAIGAEVADALRRLARVRNEAARRIDFRDHRALALTVSEIDEGWLDAFLEELDACTREPYARLKAELDDGLGRRFGIAPDELMPWHYPDPFFQETLPLADLDLDQELAGVDLIEATRLTFERLGLDVDESIAASDLAPRPGKSQHAFCLAIDRERDVRVLANVVQDAFWAGTLLHEYGHAAYDLYVDRALPFLLRCPAHPMSTEAVAILMGRLLHDPDWLTRHGGADTGRVERARDALASTRRSGRLVFTRWGLTLVHFERELYRDPEQDLNARWWELVERYQGLRKPDGRDAPDWASKIHLSTHPVYYQNYLMGEAFASQLETAIRAATGGTVVDNPDAGRFLLERVFRPGAMHSWDRLVEHATGAPLSAGALLDG